MCENHKRTYGIELEGYTDECIRGNYVQGWKLTDDGSLEDGGYECDDCNGSGERWYECDECYGSGHEECEDCCGSGEVPCGECDCTGNKECSECSGSGTMDCPDCNGRGCEECNDSGEIECGDCYGDGNLECSDCDGSGYVNCYECDGNGQVDCRYCSGEGGQESECGYCDGRGTHGSGDSGYGVECISGICNEGDYEPISKIFNYISSYDWRVHDDCGTHVHIGANDLQATDLSKLAILMNIVEPAIYGTLPSNRIYGSYAQRTKRDMVEYYISKGDEITMQEVADKYYNYHVNLDGHFGKYDSARYYGLNLHSYFFRKYHNGSPTVEFRYFEGCDSEEQAKTWIDLCVKLVDFAKYASFEQLNVIGREFYLIDNLETLVEKVQELLGLDGELYPTNSSSYRECKPNVAIQFRNTHVINRAV